jgi:hypothetical protein
VEQPRPYVVVGAHALEVQQQHAAVETGHAWFGLGLGLGLGIGFG